MAAPVAQTCPDIDKVIKRLKSAITEIKWLRKDNPEIASELNSIEGECDDAIDGMEALRQDNARLREWGLGHEKTSEWQEKYIEEKEAEIEELRTELESAKSESKYG